MNHIQYELKYHIVSVYLYTHEPLSIIFGARMN